MQSSALKILGIAYLMVAVAPVAALEAQDAAGRLDASWPMFEVASIKPAVLAGSAGMPRGLRMDKAQASFGGMSLSALISYAYRVKLQQVTGPDWLTTQRFEIVATLPKGGSTDRVPEMMQRLLVERFGLQFHRESKEVSIYALVAAKGGIKVTPKPDDFDAKTHNDQIAIPILSVTLLLEQIVDLPVVDETRLQGQYLVPARAIRQAMTAAMSPASSRPAAAGAVEASEPADTAVAGLLLPLGMKLERKKANLAILIVDSMRQSPTEN